MDYGTQNNRARRRTEEYARLLHSRLPADDLRTSEDIQNELDRDDEIRRVRDASIESKGPRIEDLERLRTWVRASEPVSSIASGYAYQALKRRYPREYWDAVIERDHQFGD